MNEREQRILELRAHLKVDAYDALIDIGKEELYEMKADVIPFLDDEDDQVRSAAIRVLGFYWTIPGYREQAWKMFENESDDDCRREALMSWASYSHQNKDPEVLHCLGEIMADSQEEDSNRTMAYVCAQEIAAVPRPEQRDVDDPEDIDWAWVERVCGVKRTSS